MILFAQQLFPVLQQRVRQILRILKFFLSLLQGQFLFDQRLLQFREPQFSILQLLGRFHRAEFCGLAF